MDLDLTGNGIWPLEWLNFFNHITKNIDYMDRTEMITYINSELKIHEAHYVDSAPPKIRFETELDYMFFKLKWG